MQLEIEANVVANCNFTSDTNVTLHGQLQPQR